MTTLKDLLGDKRDKKEKKEKKGSEPFPSLSGAKFQDQRPLQKGSDLIYYLWAL
jgi:hypothetical protein